MEILNILWPYLFGGTSIITILGGIAYRKQTRRAKEAEARQKEVEAEKAEVDVEKAKIDARKNEVDRLLEQIDHQQKTVENLIAVNTNLSTRLSKVNAALDKARDRNTELSNRVYASEQEVNRVQNLLNDEKDEIIRLTEDRDNERAAKEYYKQWICTKPICKDPEGRIPPNLKLATQTFIDPERK